MSRPLGRRAPSDWRHVERFSLTTEAPPKEPTPVVIGSIWPREADNPVKDSRGIWWIRGPFKGAPRGGHAYCLEDRNGHDSGDNWLWWNQVSEGICVSEAITRAGALIFRRRFQPRPLYDLAQQRDEFSDTPPAEGTSVRAGFDVWRTAGLIPARRGDDHWESEGEIDPSRKPDPKTVLPKNVWATDAQQVLEALGTPDRDWVALLNSWGRRSADGRRGYPHRVRLPADDLQWLIGRDGEAGIPIF